MPDQVGTVGASSQRSLETYLGVNKPDVIPECSCVCLGPSRWRMALSVFSGSHTRAWLTGPGSSRMSRLLCFVGMLSFPLGQMERPGHLLARVPQDQEGGGWGLQTCCPAPESARFTTN